MAPSSAGTLNRQLLDFHRIRYFLALCEELSFTRAARKCGVSQPSLTNSIRLLEEQLGSQLFERKPHVRLTQLGAAIRPPLQAIEFQALHVLEIAQRYQAGPRRDAAESHIDAATAQFVSIAVLASPSSGGEHDDRFKP
jgi:DNA-binding transcriptional LysR family regulator